MREISKELFNVINDADVDSIAACCVGYNNFDLIDALNSFGYDLSIYDYNPYLENWLDGYNKVDVVIDKVDLDQELIINFNAENTYPLGKIYKGKHLVVYDDQHHNGNCTNYDPDIIENIASDNHIDIKESGRVFCFKRNYYYVLGDSIG